MSNVLLDTNILILALRQNPLALSLLEQFIGDGDSLFVSSVTRTEILAGMHPREEEATFALLDTIPVLPVDMATADRAGRLIYTYARQGIQLSLPDAMIGATALQRNLLLYTTNRKHYPFANLDVRGLPSR
ncbi:MAG: type II toxin-antitoxin system VapC family toxin [Chloroflexi bacterium]|nr:MAG: type II toxin-antitoxin system VapC family toxin [Chloroflexota bacterium]